MRRIAMIDAARTEETKENIRRGSQIGGHIRLLVHVRMMVLALTTLSVMSAGVALADDQSLPSMTVGYQNGTITAIYEKTLDIDGRTYGLMPEVVILNQRGRTMEPRDLVVSADVKFHVTNDDNNKIDKMIVTFPR
jgi:hypothetical protein